MRFPIIYGKRKRQRAAALQNLAAIQGAWEDAAASWSAAVLCRFLLLNKVDATPPKPRVNASRDFSPRRVFELCALVLLFLIPPAYADETNTPSTQPIPIVESKRTDQVDFEKEILPVLRNNCLACHNQTKAKAGLILETPLTILKGGESGSAVVAGKGSESLLLKAASHREKPTMPPKDNKVNALDLTPAQLGLIKLWIDQGAQGDVRGAAPMEWRPLPEAVNPIYAVSVTPDGQFAACARANQIFVYHIPSGQLVQALTDPGLTVDSRNGSNPPPVTLPRATNSVAHLDLVHSLAFSPDGNLLASGGYREAKLWRRQRKERKSLPATNTVCAIAASPNGQWLATGSANGRVILWDANRKEQKCIAGDRSADQRNPSENQPSTPRVIGLKFSPDGSLLCSATADRTLRVWAVPQAELLAQTNLADEITAVAWVGRNKQISTAGADKLIRLWQISDGTNAMLNLIKELEGHEGAITCLEAFPTTGEILSGDAGGSIRLWNIETGKTVLEWQHGGPVAALAIRSDGARFASAGLNNLAKLWDGEDGEFLGEMKGDRYAQEFLTETERNFIVATNEVGYRRTSVGAEENQQKSATERLTKATESFAAAEKTLGEKQKQLQGATESRTAAEKTLADLEGEFKKAREDFQAGEKAAKQAATEAKAALEKATQAKMLADQAAQTKAETERIALDAAAVASKSKTAAMNLADSIKAAAETIAADAAAVAEKAKLFAETAAQDASAKSKVANDSKVAVEKAIDEVAAKSFALGEMKPRLDKLTAESPEKIKQAGEKLASATNALPAIEKELKKAELAKSTTEHDLQLAKAAAQKTANAVAQAKSALQAAEEGQKRVETEQQNARKKVLASEQPIRALAFSPDNLTLASGGDDHMVHTWSAETGAAFESFKGNTTSVFAVAFFTSNTLISCSSDEGVALLDLKPAWTLERVIGTGGADSPLIDRVNALRFSPDGKLLATGGGEPSRSGEILLWTVSSGTVAKEFKNVHSDAVLALDFSPDGQYLASGAADKFVKVAELATGSVVKTFEGHLQHVLGVSWKRDGRTLASSGADNVVKVWDFVSGERKKNIEGFTKEVTSVAFIDATDQALTSSGDNQVRLVRENGDNVRTFAGATDYVYSAVATPDGKIVIAGGQDSMLRVWSGQDGRMLTTFAPPATLK